MFHEQGISAYPRLDNSQRTRSLKEIRSTAFDDDTFDATRKLSKHRLNEVDDLKVSLNRVMFDRELSDNDFIRRPGRKNRQDGRRNTTGLTEYEIRQNHANSPVSHTVKDHEWLIQDLKKENFDLKLRLFMEQKEREKLLNGNSRQTGDLEADLTEALDELEHAMDKENQLSHELNAARRREKSLATKLKRLERVCQHQEEDIIRMSVELENLKMEMAGGITSPSATRTRPHQSRSGRMSPTSDYTDRYSDRLSAGYPERMWERYSDRNSDRGSDSGSYVTTPHERKAFFGDRFPDDISTSDESEPKNRTLSTANSDAERMKRREKLLSRRVRQHPGTEENGLHEDDADGEGDSRDHMGDPNVTSNSESLKDNESASRERAIDVAPDLLKSTPDTHSPGQKKGGFTRPRWFQKKSKGSKQTSKSMDDLNRIGRIDVKNIHKKNKKYNFWGCVRARESINENIRSEYAPVKRPQVNTGNNATNGTAEPASVDYI